MTAPNHALTGALIGFAIGNPWLAVPAAFLSHFVCDAIPHYEAPGTEVQRIGSKRLITEQLLIGGGLCLLIVLSLAAAHPVHWLLASCCAFVATSPDLFWIPRWLHVRRTRRDVNKLNWFLQFHHDIQWKTAPRLIWLEAVWFVSMGTLVFVHL